MNPINSNDHNFYGINIPNQPLRKNGIKNENHEHSPQNQSIVNLAARAFFNNNGQVMDPRLPAARKLNLPLQHFTPFNQKEAVISLISAVAHKTLMEINRKYNGLCDLICNRILIDGRAQLTQGRIDSPVDPKLLRTEINVEKINQTQVKKSHILSVYPLFKRAIAYLFGIYPDNIFSFREQWRLVRKTPVPTLDVELFKKGLERVQDGTTLKLAVIEKKSFEFQGHSLLIKKVGQDNFTFFDPNNGEYKYLKASDLAVFIQDQLDIHKGNDLFLTSGNEYLKKIS